MSPATSKAPAAATTEAPRKDTSESPDFRPLSGYAAKQFESLRALARFGLVRELQTLDAVAAFLDGMGVQP